MRGVDLQKCGPNHTNSRSTEGTVEQLSGKLLVQWHRRENLRSAEVPYSHSRIQTHSFWSHLRKISRPVARLPPAAWRAPQHTEKVHKSVAQVGFNQRASPASNNSEPRNLSPAAALISSRPLANLSVWAKARETNTARALHEKEGGGKRAYKVKGLQMWDHTDRESPGGHLYAPRTITEHFAKEDYFSTSRGLIINISSDLL